jgi:Ca2+-binding EF-hand superfamily protein
MKTTIQTTMIGVLLLAGGMATTWAEPGSAPARLTWFLKLFDADGNGVLDEEERQAAKEYLRKKREEVIAEWDKDGDGKLSGKEIAALRQHIREKIRAKRYERFLEIAGEDKLISEEEFAAMPVFAERDPDKVAKLFGFLDRDDDGQLSFREFLLHFRRHR